MEETGNKKILIRVGAILVVIAAIGAFVFFKKPQTTNNTNQQNTDQTNTENTGVEATGGTPIITVEPTDVPSTRPSLDRQVQVTDTSLTAEVKADLVKKIQDATAKLKINPSNLGTWFELGLYRKAIGDYTGAAEIWEYVVVSRTGDFITMHNLADLYRNYLKDYPKAEKYYLKYMQLNAGDFGAAIDLHQMYWHQYTAKKDQADDVLVQYLAKHPDSVEVLVELARYYKAVGDTSNARIYYQRALNAAQKAKSPGAASIEAELKSL